MISDPQPTPEDVRRVLEERARALARPSVAEGAPDADHLELLVFSLGGERYGVDASRVAAVLPPVSPTPLPGARAALAGVVNHRGEVLAVLDLRGLLGMAGAEALSGIRIVVVDVGGMVLGLRADEVIGLARVEAAAPGPQLARPEGGLPEWIRGVTGGMVSVVDLEALARDRRVRVEEA
jgi:purine-binding chemotaxis protein CheW